MEKKSIFTIGWSDRFDHKWRELFQKQHLTQIKLLLLSSNHFETVFHCRKQLKQILDHFFKMRQSNLRTLNVFAEEVVSHQNSEKQLPEGSTSWFEENPLSALSNMLSMLFQILFERLQNHLGTFHLRNWMEGIIEKVPNKRKDWLLISNCLPFHPVR